MKSYKHLLSLVLALALVLSLIPGTARQARAAECSGSCGENLTWKMDTDSGVLTISGSGPMEDYRRSGDGVAAPWYDAAAEITQVVIDSGVTTIGSWAFQKCANMTAITIPGSVQKLGDAAFWGCKQLKGAVLPKGISAIPRELFWGCENLESVDIPEGVTVIGSDAFANCVSLKSITLPDSVAFVYSRVFSGCSGLTEVTLSQSLTNIGTEMFSNCTSLKAIHIPDRVQSVGDYAFSGCISLESAQLPEAIDEIPLRIFYNCSSLKSIVLPDSVTRIRSMAFSGCTGLKSVTLPDGLARMDDAAFENCSSLESISIPDSVTQLGDFAFSGCTALTGIVLPEGIRTLEDSVFSGCTGLTAIEIPETIHAIGRGAFQNCTGLTRVTLPEWLEELGAAAFKGCTGLEEIRVYNPTCNIENTYALQGAALGVPDTTMVYGFRDSTAEAYADRMGYTFCGIGEELPEPDGTTAPHFVDKAEWELLRLVNRERNQAGLDPVTVVSALQKACDIREKELAEQYGHFRPDGTDFSSVLEDVDADPYMNARSLLENIHRGASDAEEAAAAWFADGDARAILLKPELRHAGMGHFHPEQENYWVQLFYSRTGGSSTDLKLLLPGSMTFYIGTGIDDMDITGKLSCSYCGAEYLPILGAYCTGFDSGKAGTQMVQVFLRNMTASFEVTLVCPGHEYEAVVTAPTCTEQGYTTHTCTLCGDSYVDTYTKALGHDWKLTERKEPTAITEGYARYVCTRCGEVKTEILPVDPSKNPFKDIYPDDYYYVPALWALENGITNGKPGGIFAPLETCTRAQAVTFLWRAAGCPEPESTAQRFPDVPLNQTNEFFYKAVAWAAERGITNGRPNGNFCPMDPVNRSEFVTFLWRAEGKPQANAEVSFKDLDKNEFYYDAVMWAVENGITNGKPGNVFDPLGRCIRGEVVTFLYRCFA